MRDKVNEQHIYKDFAKSLHMFFIEKFSSFGKKLILRDQLELEKAEEKRRTGEAKTLISNWGKSFA